MCLIIVTFHSLSITDNLSEETFAAWITGGVEAKLGARLPYPGPVASAVYGRVHQPADVRLIRRINALAIKHNLTILNQGKVTVQQHTLDNAAIRDTAGPLSLSSILQTDSILQAGVVHAGSFSCTGRIPDGMPLDPERMFIKAFWLLNEPRCA